MRKVNSSGYYKIEQVPDVYVCDTKGTLLYYSNVITDFKIEPKEDFIWECSIKMSIGNIRDWFNFLSNTSLETFYFRTTQKNCLTGETEWLCFVISPEEIYSGSFILGANKGSFDFPIKFKFNINNLIWINDEDCPQYEVLFIKNETPEYHFIKPKHTYKEVKIKHIRDRLSKMRGN